MKSSTSRILVVVILSIFTVSVDLEAQTAPTTGTTSQQSRPHDFQNLDLTDAQRAQIKQIRENTPKGKERRQEIMAILTPEQKAMAKQDAQEWKAQHQ